MNQLSGPMSQSNSVIVRVKGGLGNQLFCYAVSRRLSMINNVELVIDDVTGFVRDRIYRRRYALDHFSIPCRKANAWERMEPFERGRRALSKWVSRRRPFEARTYIEQEGSEFDQRLLTLRPQGTLYLDGLWQDERYFFDISDTLRSELRFNLSPNAENATLARRISACQAVALHVRWYDPAAAPGTGRNLTTVYYEQAMQRIKEQIESPHFFLFSDDIAATMKMLRFPSGQVTPVNINGDEVGAIFDLWLMSQCQHFIIANSTFSWWGAWLGRPNGGIILTPSDTLPIYGTWVWGGRGGSNNFYEISSFATK